MIRSRHRTLFWVLMYSTEKEEINFSDQLACCISAATSALVSEITGFLVFHVCVVERNVFALFHLRVTKWRKTWMCPMNLYLLFWRKTISDTKRPTKASLFPSRLCWVARSTREKKKKKDLCEMNTVISSDEGISIFVLQLSIHVFFSLFKRYVHVSIQVRQNSWCQNKENVKV